MGTLEAPGLRRMQGATTRHSVDYAEEGATQSDGQRWGFPKGAGRFWAATASLVVGIVTTIPPPRSLSRSKIGSAIVSIIW